MRGELKIESFIRTVRFVYCFHLLHHHCRRWGRFQSGVNPRPDENSGYDMAHIDGMKAANKRWAGDDQIIYKYDILKLKPVMTTRLISPNKAANWSSQFLWSSVIWCRRSRISGNYLRCRDWRYRMERTGWQCCQLLPAYIRIPLCFRCCCWYETEGTAG